MSFEPEPPLDDRLREAFRAAVDTVQPGTIKSEVLIGAPSRHRRRLAMLAPLAAAAAVALAIGGAMAIPHLDSAAAHPATRTASRPVTGNGQPPFVLLQDAKQSRNPAYEVRSAVTGQLTATITPPRPGAYWVGATGSGTGRTFVLSAETRGATGSVDSCDWSAYTLRLTAAGSVSSLSPLSVPGTPDNGSMTITTPVLSADGSTLAYVASQCGGPVRPSYQDTIVVAAHGNVHRYAVTLPGLSGGKPVSSWISSLSLSANGSELGYVTGEYAFSYPTVPGGAWVLATSAPSGPAAQSAHEIFTDGTRRGPWANALVLSSDASTGYLLARTGGPHTLGYALSAYDVGTGSLTRVLHTWHGLPFQAGTEVAAGDRAIIWGWAPNQAAEVNLGTGAAAPYLPRALAKVAVTGLAW
jgi:hypothetical protein